MKSGSGHLYSQPKLCVHVCVCVWGWWQSLSLITLMSVMLHLFTLSILRRLTGKENRENELADCVCEGAYCVISTHTLPSTQTCLKTEKSLGQLNHRLLSLTITQACLLLFSIFCQVFVFLYLLFSIHYVCCYVCISLVHYLAALNKLFQTSVACCFLNSKKNGRGENREEKKERTITDRENVMDRWENNGRVKLFFPFSISDGED